MRNKLLLSLLLLSISLSAQENETQQWWNLFEDETLTEIIDSGVINNQTIQASRAQVDRSHQVMKLNKSQLFPTLYGNGRWNNSATAQRDADYPTFDDKSVTASLTLDARYSVSSLGKEMQAYRAARQSFYAQEEDHKSIVLQSSTQMAQLYFDAVFAKGQLRILQKQKENAEQLLELTRKRYEVGQSSGLALLQQRQQLASVEATVPPAELQFQNSIEYLAAATFISSEKLSSLVPDSLPELDEIVEQSYSIDHRSDLASSEFREAAARAFFAKAKLTALPTLAITGSTGFNYNDVYSKEWNDTWSIGASISIPIITGGAISSGYKEGRAGYRTAVANSSQSWQNAHAELTNALTAERSYRDQYNAFLNQYESSEAVYNESIRQYRNGLVQYIEVLSSINMLQQSEITVLRSSNQLLKARLNTIKAVGGVVPSNVQGGN